MKKTITLLSLLFILITTICFGNDVPAENTASDEYNSLILLGENYKEQNDLTNALLSYQKAISLNPNCGDAHKGIAKIYANMKRYEDAVREFEKAIGILQSFVDNEIASINDRSG